MCWFKNCILIESFKIFHDLSKNSNNFNGKGSFYLRSCFMCLVLFKILQENNLVEKTNVFATKDKADEFIEFSKIKCKEMNVYNNLTYLYEKLPLSDRKSSQDRSIFSEVIADF